MLEHVYHVSDDMLATLQEKLREREEYFCESPKISEYVYESPFPDIVVVATWHGKKGFFAYTSFAFYKDEIQIGDMLRNYYPTGGYYLEHSNGKRYFINGFDYQGYTAIDLDDEIAHHYLPPEAQLGHGWCPVEWSDYNPETNQIKVAGCYWAFPHDIRTLDFSCPENPPYEILDEQPYVPEPEDDDE